MKTNTLLYICFTLILLLFVINDNNAVSVESYNPKYIPVSTKDTTIQDKARDVGISFTHAALCSLPGTIGKGLIKGLKGILKAGLSIAPYIDCVFSIFLTFFNIGPKYITKEEFDQRIKEVFKNMTIYVENRIEDTIIESTRINYESIRAPLLNLRSMMDYMDYEMNTTETISTTTQDSIVSNYWIVVNVLEQALSQYGDRNRIHMVGTLYFETAMLLASVLRDALIYGENMGLPTIYVNELSDDFPSVKKKIINTSSIVLNKYSEMLNNIITIQNKNTKIKKEEKKYKKDYLNRNNYTLPQLSSFVSSFHYSNLELYNGSIYFINEEPSNDDYESMTHIDFIHTKALKLELNKEKGSIYVVDFLFISKFESNDTKALISGTNKKTKQHCDWVTGIKGIYVHHFKFNVFMPKFGMVLKFTSNNNQNIRFRIHYADNVENQSGLTKNWPTNSIELQLVSHDLYPESSDEFDPYEKHYFNCMFYLKNTNNGSCKTRIITNPLKEISGRYYLETSAINLNFNNYNLYIKQSYEFSLILLSLEIIT